MGESGTYLSHKIGLIKSGGLPAIFGKKAGIQVLGSIRLGTSFRRKWLRFREGKERGRSVDNGSAAGANTERSAVVFVVGSGVLMLGVLSVRRGRSLVGD
jgi:hypothetical protein